MLAGNVVTTAIEEAALREQIATTEEGIDLVTRQLEIVERLEQIGAVAKLDIVTQSGELAATRATLPALRQRLEQARHRLAVYLGQPPASAQLPELRLADLRLPAELPVSLPSDLARQRPDIRAAEALLHEASARVGVATANLYPRITLSGQGGAVAVTPLLSGVAGFALLGASLAQPIFHGGELKAQKRVAVAAFDQAGAAYREVVLSGLQNVADILVALDADARTLRERRPRGNLAETAYEITSHQYEAGGVSLLALLEAQRRQVSASTEVTRVSPRVSRTRPPCFRHSAAGGGRCLRRTRQRRRPALRNDEAHVARRQRQREGDRASSDGSAARTRWRRWSCSATRPLALPATSRRAIPPKIPSNKSIRDRFR